MVTVGSIHGPLADLRCHGKVKCALKGMCLTISPIGFALRSVHTHISSLLLHLNQVNLAIVPYHQGSLRFTSFLLLLAS